MGTLTLWSLAVVFAAPLPGGTAAATAPRVVGAGDDDRAALAKIWDDPTFQRQFLGSYGVNADVEPRVSPDEVKILDKIRPLMAERLSEADETLVQSMKPDCSAVLDFTLGSLRFQQDRMDDALASYRNAVQKFPSFKRAWRNIGLIEAKDGRYDEAIKAFTRMIVLGGGDSYAYGLLGISYAAKQDFQAAEAAFRNALLLQPENTQWRLQLTRCVFKQGKFEDAAALLDVLIQQYPDEVNFWLYQAQSYLGMKQPLKAAENLEALALLGRASAETLYTLADVYFNESLPDLQARAALRAIDADPKQLGKNALRVARQLTSRGALAEARQVTKHMHEVLDAQIVDAERRDLLKLEARLAMAEGGGGDDAVKVLEEVVKLDPLDGEALMLLGQHYAKHNEPDRAIFWYERAEGIEASEGTAKLRHAQVLVSLSRYADALPLLRRAHELMKRDDVGRYVEEVERLSKARR
jgi:tetratricopeptide (TPR) repeat protein